MRLARDLRLRNVDVDVPDPTELLDRRFRVVERLAMLAELVGHGLHAMALLGACDHDGRLSGGLDGAGVGPVDRGDVVPVDLDRLPAEGLGSTAVGGRVPLVHRRARLAEPVDVDDRGQVVEAVEAGLLEGLPHRALGHLGVAAEAPDAIREPVQALAGEPDADADRQALAEGAGRDVDPWEDRRGMALDPAAEPAKGEHLVVADRAGRLEHRVQQRGGVALAEDQVVVARVIGVAEVVVQVLRHQHGHEVGRGHRRGRVAAPRGARGTDRVDPQLLPELVPLVLLGGHACSLRKLSAQD